MVLTKSKSLAPPNEGPLTETPEFRKPVFQAEEVNQDGEAGGEQRACPVCPPTLRGVFMFGSGA